VLSQMQVKSDVGNSQTLSGGRIKEMWKCV